MHIMKIKNRTRRAPSRLLTVALISMVAGLAERAAAQSLNARIIARPVTPGDVKLYNLPASTEYSGGLSNFALGTPAYLELDVAKSVSLASITNITWTLTAPTGSAAALTNSPLPATMPVFLPSDRSVYQVAGRMVLRPDIALEPYRHQFLYSHRHPCHDQRNDQREREPQRVNLHRCGHVRAVP